MLIFWDIDIVDIVFVILFGCDVVICCVFFWYDGDIEV